MRLKITIIFIGLFFNYPSFAENTSGFFLKSGIGAALIAPETTAPSWVTDPAFSWNLGGGYRFNEYFGIEGGFRDFGEFSGTNIENFCDGCSYISKTKITGSAWTIGGFANYEILPNIEVNARAGWYAWHFESKYQSNFTTPYYHDSYNGKNVAHSNDPYVGAGAAWSLNKNISLGIDWIRFIFSDPNSLNDLSINTFEITGQYRF